jgi:hypothetical protein
MDNFDQKHFQTGATDPIIAAVQALAAGYHNTDYAKRAPVKLAGANIYTVAFKGEDSQWREAYVFERGNTRIAYWSIADMLMYRDNDLISSGPNLDLLRLCAVIGFTLLFLATYLYLSVKQPTSPSLQILTGLLGAGFAFLVGNRPGTKRRELTTQKNASSGSVES